MIHFGCAIEYEQPSLIAEALAAACVHDNWPKQFLLTAEQHALSHPELGAQSLLEVVNVMREDPVISHGVKHTDPFNKIADGLMKRVGGEYFAPFLSRLRVERNAEDIRRKLNEMMHTSIYLLGAAQKPGKRVALDFVLLHNATLSAYYPALMEQDWLSIEEKAKLLESKMRVDAILFAGCGCPTLYPERIIEYTPLHLGHGWADLIHRANIYRDEGHAAKLMRALYALDQYFDEIACELPISKADFIKIAHMAMDSIEEAVKPGGTAMPEQRAKLIVSGIGHGGEMVRDNLVRWVFYGGLDHAWDFVPALASA